MGRPIIATILSFGLELPLSIGGVAIYIIVMHGNLLGVYWLNAIIVAFEVAIVLFLLFRSNWDYWAQEAQRRQEAGTSDDDDDDDDNNEGEGNESTTPLLEGNSNDGANATDDLEESRIP